MSSRAIIFLKVTWSDPIVTGCQEIWYPMCEALHHYIVSGNYPELAGLSAFNSLDKSSDSKHSVYTFNHAANFTGCYESFTLLLEGHDKTVSTAQSVSSKSCAIKMGGDFPTITSFSCQLGQGIGHGKSWKSPGVCTDSTTQLVPDVSMTTHACVLYDCDYVKDSVE